MTKREKIEYGKKVFESEQYNNPFRSTAHVAKIIYHEYFTSGHNDTAISISLCDSNGGTLWKTTISDTYEENAWALKAYLQDRFMCPVEEIEL